ncbi:MAG: hypothetical protein JNL81_11655 [Hyphomonadaceae bacterium]|nr:hypothetical protein [Hyphomonadaceae bacterium]
MPAWIIAAAIGSILITALLTWLLYQMNKPLLAQARADRGDRAESEGADDGGGGDGGGD